MQCPACGYDAIPEEACFCPHCRYQFQVPENDMLFESLPSSVPAGRHCCTPADTKFTRKERRTLEVIALQPAVLLMLAVAVIIYTASGRIAELSVTAGTIEIRYGGFACLLAGAVIAWIFYRIVLYRAE
jgi:hypothetical protein